MRADRLISLLMLLQTRGRLTAQELARLLEVSERTIYRDLDALSGAGIPVYAERGPGGGISLVDGYQTRLTGLTGPEAQALFLLSVAGPLSDLGLERALNDALLKLSATLPGSQREEAQHLRERIHMDTTWWYYSRETLPHLPVLQEAVCHDQTILLFYLDEHKSPGHVNRHLLNPYGLVSKAGIWFLVAAHPQSGEQHILRVSRIQSVEFSGESFVRPSNFDLAATWRDYCFALEAQHPQLASSFRAIPGETLQPAGTEFILHSADLWARRRAQQKKFYGRSATKKRAFYRLSLSTATSKKAFLLFTSRQPATNQQKKAKMGLSQQKNKYFASKKTKNVSCNAFPHACSRAFLWAKPARATISLLATCF